MIQLKPVHNIPAARNMQVACSTLWAGSSGQWRAESVSANYTGAGEMMRERRDQFAFIGDRLN